MITARSFWDKAARKYAARPVKDQQSYEHTLERTRAYLTPDSAALELGCGTGSTALLLASSLKSITATDISGEMIAIAQAKLAAEDPGNVAFAQATLEDPMLAAGGYDVVLAFNLLHLLEDPERGLQRIHALLKPGGLFISKTVCLGEKHGFFRPIIAVMRLFGKAPKVTFLKVADLEKIVRDAGFEILETGDFPASPPSHFIAARTR